MSDREKASKAVDCLQTARMYLDYFGILNSDNDEWIAELVVELSDKFGGQGVSEVFSKEKYEETVSKEMFNISSRNNVYMKIYDLKSALDNISFYVEENDLERAVNAVVLELENIHGLHPDIGLRRIQNE